MNWYHYASDFGHWVFFPIFKQNQMFPSIEKDLEICNIYIIVSSEISYYVLWPMFCASVSHIALPQTFPSPWLCSCCFSIWNTQFSASKITADSAQTLPHLSHFLCLLSSAPTALTSLPTFGAVFVFSTNLRSSRISRTKHLKMKCWMKE